MKKNCKYCGKEFEPKNSKGVFCKTAHRVAWSRGKRMLPEGAKDAGLRDSGMVTVPRDELMAATTILSLGMKHVRVFLEDVSKSGRENDIRMVSWLAEVVRWAGAADRGLAKLRQLIYQP